MLFCLNIDISCKAVVAKLNNYGNSLSANLRQTDTYSEDFKLLLTVA